MNKRVRASAASIVDVLSALEHREKIEALERVRRMLLVNGDPVEQQVDEAFDATDCDDAHFQEWLGAWRLGWAEVAAAYARTSLSQLEEHFRNEATRLLAAAKMPAARHAERIAARELQALRREMGSGE